MVNINYAFRAGLFIIATLGLFAALFVGSALSVHAQVVPGCTIAASPSSLGGSGSVNLLWNSTNATSASINYGVGSVGTSGSWNIATLAETRTYVLTVTGMGGTNTCSVTIPVGTTTAPTCTLVASPENVGAGNATTLSWTTTNSTSAILNTVGTVATAGSYTVYPTTTTTYQLTAVGAGGNTTCTRTVTVNGTGSNNTLPTCSLSMQPDIVFANGSAVITYNASGATSAWIDGGVGTVYGTGTKTVYNITAPRTYTMTATNSYGTTRCSDTVSVAGAGYTAYPNNTQPNYAYPYQNYAYPTNTYAHATPTYYTPSQAYQYPRAGQSIQIARMPYTGPEDALYVSFMAMLTLVIGTILYRNRVVVLG